MNTCGKILTNEVQKPAIYENLCGYFSFLSGTKTFTDGFTVDDDITVEGLIEGVNLLRLYQEAVLSWRDAEISGRKVGVKHKYKFTSANNVITFPLTNVSLFL